MKLIFLILSLHWVTVPVRAQLFDISRLAPLSQAEVAASLQAASTDLVHKIAIADWKGVYPLLADEIQRACSEREFVEKCDYKASVPTMTFLGKVFIVEDREESVAIFCQVIYREAFVEGTNLFRSLTWSYDIRTQRWQCMNLPFERFKFLPMQYRFRFR